MKIRYSKAFKLTILLGIITELFYLAFVFINGDDGNIPLYMFIYFEAFILFFLAWFTLSKKENDEQPSISFPFLKLIKKIFNTDDRTLAKLKLPLIIILFGILFRFTLFPTAPTTSPDVYRYIWEGKVLTNGYNPFLLPPDSPQLEHLRDDVYEKVTFKDMRAIYPPFSQIIFAISYFISGGVLGLKLFYLLFEILTLVFLLKLLLYKNKNPNLIILYAWLPLPIMEFFINVHLDAIGISLLIIFLYFIEKDKIVLAAIPFALSFLAKLYPLMLIPLLIKKVGIKNFPVFIIWFAGISLLFYLPFVYNDIHVIESLLKYLSHWEFNGSVYNLVKYFSNGQIAKEICAVLLIISVATISIRYNDFTKAVFAVFLCYIIFAATIYPWYLGWIAALNPAVGFTSIMSLFFTVNVSNFTPLGDVWREYLWVLLVQYIPFFGFLIFDLRRVFRKKNFSNR